MKSFTFRAAWGLGLALFWSSPLTAADKQGDLRQLRVSVFNSASISPKAIEHAEGEASRILEDAGVAVIWLNCPQDSQHEVSRGRCTEASFPLHLHLRIARVSRGLKPSTVGISFSAEDGQGCYVDLFYEPIRQLEEETHVALRVILGHAMAHELGHLLLGTNSHSASGLMRAHWTREELTKAAKGNLGFSREQSLRIMYRLAQKTPRDPQRMVSAPRTSNNEIGGDKSDLNE